jgi:hypothetical protein
VTVTLEEELQGLGDLRPGSISKQYRKPKEEKEGGFYQISYTHKMRSKSGGCPIEC